MMMYRPIRNSLLVCCALLIGCHSDKARQKADFTENDATVSFRENDQKPWNVIEIIQRMSYFLRERWQDTHPASMYRSKQKALELYIAEGSRDEFRKLYDVLRDIVILPE